MSNDCSVSPEVGEQLLRAYLTESPKPSQEKLAQRFNLTRSAVQRYLAKHSAVLPEAVKVASDPVKAELVVRALPAAMQEIKTITKDLAITSLCKVLEEATAQYERYRDDDNPSLAGGYLDQMRKTVIDMGKWLNIEKDLGIQDKNITININWRKGAGK